MPDSTTPAGIGRSATDSLTDLHKVGTTSPQPNSSPALVPISNLATGANLSTTTTSSSTFRGRSNSALPKLSTTVSSHFHAPWKFGADSRNESRHRHTLSSTATGIQTGQGKLHIHHPHLQHHTSSQYNRSLLRRPGVGTVPVSAITPANGSELRLVKTTTAVEEVMDPLKLERERQRAEARNKDIDTVFQRISDVASQATQKLDRVYYSILEKMAVLKSTLGNMQEIYDQAKGLDAQFRADADAVQRDVQEQADTFDGFRDQTKQIEVLESRINTSKKKIDSLSDRLEAARERVLKLENQEAEVQKHISFQFRIAYGIIGMIALIFLTILIINLFSRPVNQLKASLATNNTASITIPNIIQTPVGSADEPSASTNFTEDALFSELDFSDYLGRKDNVASPLASSTHSPDSDKKEEDEVCLTSIEGEDDPRLRLFDEL